MNIFIISTLIIVGIIGIIFYIKQNKKEKEIKKENISETKQIEKKDTIKNLPKEIEELKNINISEKIKDEIKIAMEEYQLDDLTIKNMFKEAVELLKNQEKKIYELINTKNWSELERITHNLKGAMLNLKFYSLGNSLKYINENLKKEEDLENMKLYFDIIFAKAKNINF